MPAGTIALTNNSATVTGTGTSFTTELKVNDFLVSTVGGLAYTLGVKSIESNTSLTLMENFTGPTASGQSWTPVPYGTMTAITAQLASQVTYAIRGFNLDKANWQQIFTGTGTVTVTLPDGTSWQGPSWGYMATQFANKASLDGATFTGRIVANGGQDINGGLYLNGNLAFGSPAQAATARANMGVSYGTTSGTVAQGNDARLDTINNKSGGIVTTDIQRFSSTSGARILSRSSYRPNTSSGQTNNYGGFNYGYGTNSAWSAYGIDEFLEFIGNYFYINRGIFANGSWYTWQFREGGNAVAINGSWVNSSDRRLKNNIELIGGESILDNPDFLAIRGYKWIRRDGIESVGVGLIAQDVQALIPEAVTVDEGVIKKLVNGEEVDNPLYLDVAGASAAMHQEAIIALVERLKKQETVIEELLMRMKAIDGLDA
jgi:hypothetical protein